MSSFVAVPYGEICPSKGGTPCEKETAKLTPCADHAGCHADGLRQCREKQRHCRRVQCRDEAGNPKHLEVNRQVYDFLNFEDTSELENAERGFIAAPDTLNLRGENGRTVWTQDAYAFLDKDAPDTANPSLWRNTQLNHIYGLFEVTDGIYQVRGYDISNITFVRSEHGWIIMDCGSSKYTAAEALKLFRSEMGDARIVAIVISHAHVDHYGGIEGLIAPEDAADSSLPLDEQIASGKNRNYCAERLYGRGNEGKMSLWARQ